MFNFDPNVVNVSQLELLNVSTGKSNKVNDVENSSVNSAGKETQEDVKVNLSQQVLSQINEIMSEEEIISSKMQKAQIIYDSLADIRLKLQDLMALIKDPEVQFDISKLEYMDSMSNSLINSVIDVVKKNDDMNIVNPDFLNIYFSGLNSIKRLNLSDNEFITKIELIDSNVQTQENEYLKATESLYSKYVDITKKYEDLISANDFKDVDKTIDKEIIALPEETIASTTANISSETVKRLLLG